MINIIFIVFLIIIAILILLKLITREIDEEQILKSIPTKGITHENLFDLLLNNGYIYQRSWVWRFNFDSYMEMLNKENRVCLLILDDGSKLYKRVK